MNKYLIEMQKYDEKGTPIDEFSHKVAETPQGAMDLYSQYNKMRYTSVDEEGKTIVGNKMYKVTLKQGIYKPIEDIDAFVEMNGVEYHK